MRLSLQPRLLTLFLSSWLSPHLLGLGMKINRELQLCCQAGRGDSFRSSLGFGYSSNKVITGTDIFILFICI